MSTRINAFRNEYYFLSNFYEIPVTYQGITYQNNEAAFQAQKCVNEKDKLKFKDLNASEAKKLGRQITLRKDWEDVKIRIMQEIVTAKFEQHPDLANKLLDTKDAYLEEGNTWGDRVWGTVDGKGANNLGIILMEERERQKELVRNEMEERDDR